MIYLFIVLYFCTGFLTAFLNDKFFASKKKPDYYKDAKTVMEERKNSFVLLIFLWIPIVPVYAVYKGAAFFFRAIDTLLTFILSHNTK